LCPAPDRCRLLDSRAGSVIPESAGRGGQPDVYAGAAAGRAGQLQRAAERFGPLPQAGQSRTVRIGAAHSVVADRQAPAGQTLAEPDAATAAGPGTVWFVGNTFTANGGEGFPYAIGTSNG
jgi:hypothetical protein